MPLPWTGPIDLDVGQARRCAIGPLTIVVARHDREHEIAWSRGADPLDATMVAGESVPPSELTNHEGALRLPGTENPLVFAAMNADRPMITRPLSPVVLAPGTAVVVYVSNPVWLQVSVLGHSVFELPSWRPSDTWYGSDKRNGDLCYASRTRARLLLDQLEHAPSRVTTAARIENASEASLQIPRIGLPLPSMSLFSSESGRLWTEAVEMRVDTDGSSPTIVAPAPPAEAGAVEFVAGPRTPPETGGLVRAFSALLDMSGD